MLKKLFRFLRGYVTILLVAKETEFILNYLTKKGFCFWDITREDGYLQAKLDIDGFMHLRQVLKGKRRCKVRIQKKTGLPFVLAYIRRRPGLMAGIIIFILILNLAGSFIWSLEINGLHKLTYKEIYEELKRLNAVPGVWVCSLDMLKLEKDLLIRFPLLAWVDIQQLGTLLAIEVVEKKQLVLPDLQHIVARRGGIIEEIIPLKGAPVVQAGDTVKKGEILIEGTEERRAFGIVRAKTWYDAAGEAPVLYQEARLTGRSVESTKLYIKGKKITSLGVADIPFPYYTLEKKIYNWGNIQLVREVYREKEKYFHYYSSPTARYLARDKAVRSILGQLTAETRITDIYEEIIPIKDGIIQVRLLLEAREDIAH